MNLGAVVALAGMNQAQGQVERSAERLARMATSTAGGPAGGGDVVDLSAEMLALMQAKNYHSALVAVARTSQEMDSHLVKLLA